MRAQPSMDKISHFAEYDEQKNELSIIGSKLKETDAGFYAINVTASISSQTYREEISGRFRLQVLPRFPAIIPTDPTDNQTADPPQSIIKKQEWTGLIVDEADKDIFKSTQPVPYMKSISETGLLTIEWDRKIRTVDEPDQIGSTQVLLRVDQSEKLRRRQLQDFWLQSGKLEELEQVKIKQTLEISLIRDDEEDIGLLWEIVASTNSQLQIQIHLDEELMVRNNERYQLIRVTIWGNEFFKDTQENEPVRLGTTVQWPIFNQISQGN